MDLREERKGGKKIGIRAKGQDMQRGCVNTGKRRIHIHPVGLNGKGIFLGRESGGGSALLAGWPSLIRSCVAAALDRDEST